MKILHIINSLHTGGAEKLVVDTLPLFEEKGITVDLALLNAHKTPFYEKLMQNFKGKVYGFSRGSVYNPMHIFRLMPLLKKYDVIHAHLFPVQYFLVLAKILSFSRVKLIFTEHSTSNRRLQNPRLRWVERFIYQYYAKIICITEEVKKQLKINLQIPDNQLQVINNGINIEEINRQEKYSRVDFNFSSEDKLLIMVAGFRREKDQDTVIKCLKILPDNYKLILVGDGERRSDLEKLVYDQQLGKRVFFFGLRRDVIALIKMCDVAILSSHWEGFGLAAAEAMACGIPTIASDVEGLNKVVEDGGILFERGNVEDLKEKILSLNNIEYYVMISGRGKNKASKYNIYSLINKQVNLYKNI
ncbi:glycosyltransferase family 4 protein [Bergeyella porcorum]|uniref:glycosyltransferase family 4 protein n=1 Tax=Bergeyella porcorum TaxID=1735111 RepID=UPI0035E54CE0